jgi:BRO family, N-terminal domain
MRSGFSGPFRSITTKWYKEARCRGVTTSVSMAPLSIPSSDTAINIDCSRSVWRLDEHEIHFVEDVGGHVWFCAKDLARYFGYFKNGNPCAGNILRKVSKDEWKRKFGEIEHIQPAVPPLSCKYPKWTGTMQPHSRTRFVGVI